MRILFRETTVAQRESQILSIRVEAQPVLAQVVESTRLVDLVFTRDGITVGANCYTAKLYP